MTLPFIRFQGLVFRAHHPAWAFAPESGEGARIHGGRFNRAGTPCFYAALSLNTAWLEAQQGFAFKAQPLTICSYKVDCEHILDLGDPTGCAAAGVADADLSCAWERLAGKRQPVPSWQVADRLIAAGCAGILVRSYAARAEPTDRNLVLWTWSHDRPHRLKVIDDDRRLPRDQSSWS